MFQECKVCGNPGQTQCDCVQLRPELFPATLKRKRKAKDKESVKRAGPQFVEVKITDLEPEVPVLEMMEGFKLYVMAGKVDSLTEETKKKLLSTCQESLKSGKKKAYVYIFESNLPTKKCVWI